MKAIILAAGVGRRLGEHSDKSPKCLLRFGEKSLLQRHLEALQHCGIENLCIAVGYQAQLVEDQLRALSAQIDVTTVYNPDYTKGSLISLWTVREHLIDGDDILLMDADVLYDICILERLVNTGEKNCFLLDRDYEPGDEPVKLCIRDGVPVEFRKKVDVDLEYDLCGESVGFFRFSAAAATRLSAYCERYISQRDEEAPYEEAIRDLLLDTPSEFGFVDISGLPWIEIDFPEDVERANNHILSRLN